jgi:hypothetical protein
MSNKDIEIKAEIEKMLRDNSAGKKLTAYFEDMPEKKIRRAIYILASIFPINKVISNDDFVFILYMLSNNKIVTNNSFPDFIRSLNLIEFSDVQKHKLIYLIKDHFEEYCDICTFELNTLLIRIFNLPDLFKYLETLAIDASPAVLRQISDILQYEDFSSTNISDEAFESLKQRCLSNMRRMSP